MHEDRLDISSEPNPPAAEREPARFVGIQFACCGVYARIYRNREQTAYCGACPKCARTIRLRIGEGGNDARFFTAY